jgi:hypothetical protein
MVTSIVVGTQIVCGREREASARWLTDSTHHATGGNAAHVWPRELFKTRGISVSRKSQMRTLDREKWR